MLEAFAAFCDKSRNPFIHYVLSLAAAMERQYYITSSAYFQFKDSYEFQGAPEKIEGLASGTCSVL